MKGSLEPLIQGADHQLLLLYSFRSTLNSDFNPSTPGSWPAGSPAQGARNNGLSGLASISRLGLVYI